MIENMTTLPDKADAAAIVAESLEKVSDTGHVLSFVNLKIDVGKESNMYKTH